MKMTKFRHDLFLTFNLPFLCLYSFSFLFFLFLYYYITNSVFYSF